MKVSRIEATEGLHPGRTAGGAADHGVGQRRDAADGLAGPVPSPGERVGTRPPGGHRGGAGRRDPRQRTAGHPPAARPGVPGLVTSNAPAGLQPDRADRAGAANTPRVRSRSSVPTRHSLAPRPPDHAPAVPYPPQALRIEESRYIDPTAATSRTPHVLVLERPRGGQNSDRRVRAVLHHRRADDRQLRRPGTPSSSSTSVRPGTTHPQPDLRDDHAARTPSSSSTSSTARTTTATATWTRGGTASTTMATERDLTDTPSREWDVKTTASSGRRAWIGPQARSTRPIRPIRSSDVPSPPRGPA